MQIEALYQQTLDYLYSFVDYSLTRSTRYSPEHFDLNRMVTFVEYLNDPQNAYPIIHVAGTKGKGSVSAMIAAALEAAGYKVGLYTSPHLQDYAERIQINGAPILHQELIQMIAELRPYLDQGTNLTTFEITTGLAFRYFEQQGVNAAVIEVGLGGRLDATNVVIPLVSVITSLSYDHTLFLGDTLAEIAGEKAGIIKRGVPVVLSPQKDEARFVVERIAAEREATLYLVGRDFLFAPVTHSLEGQTLLVWPSVEQEHLDEYIEISRNAGVGANSIEHSAARLPPGGECGYGICCFTGSAQLGPGYQPGGYPNRVFSGVLAGTPGDPAALSTGAGQLGSQPGFCLEAAPGTGRLLSRTADYLDLWRLGR